MLLQLCHIIAVFFVFFKNIKDVVLNKSSFSMFCLLWVKREGQVTAMCCRKSKIFREKIEKRNCQKNKITS